MIDGGDIEELVPGTRVALKFQRKMKCSSNATELFPPDPWHTPQRWASTQSMPLVELPVGSTVREARTVARLGHGTPPPEGQAPLVPSWCIPVLLIDWPARVTSAEAAAVLGFSTIEVSVDAVLLPCYGMSVHRWLDSRWNGRGDDVPLRTVCRLGMAMLTCLQRAHQAGILHLDVKPDNFLLTAEQDEQPVPPPCEDDERDANPPGLLSRMISRVFGQSANAPSTTAPSTETRVTPAPNLVLIDYGLSVDHSASVQRVKSSAHDEYFYGTPAYASRRQLDASAHLTCRDDLEAVFHVLAEAAANEELPWCFMIAGPDGYTCSVAGHWIPPGHIVDLPFNDIMRLRTESHRQFSVFYTKQPAPLLRLLATVQALKSTDVPDYHALCECLQTTAAEEADWEAVLRDAHARSERVHPIIKDDRKRKRGADALSLFASGEDFDEEDCVSEAPLQKRCVPRSA